MAQKKRKMTVTQDQYQKLAKDREPKRPILANVMKAFLVGGIISLIGQLLSLFYMTYFDFTEKTVGNPTVSTLIFISAILTGLGVYDHIGQWGGAGASIPVTGFANTITSAAIDYRSEGLVLGVGGNMFKIAGPVIVFGVFSAFVVAILKTLWIMFVQGGM